MQFTSKIGKFLGLVTMHLLFINYMFQKILLASLIFVNAISLLKFSYKKKRKKKSRKKESQHKHDNEDSSFQITGSIQVRDMNRYLITRWHLIQKNIQEIYRRVDKRHPPSASCHERKVHEEPLIVGDGIVHWEIMRGLV